MRRTQRRTLRRLFFLIIIALIAIGVWKYLWKKPLWKTSKPQQRTTTQSSSKPASKIAKNHQQGRPVATSADTKHDKNLTTTISINRRPTSPNHTNALTLLKNGIEFYKQGKLLLARANLADALNSGALSDKQADQARQLLKEIADKTIFSRKVFKGDPCTFWYTFQPGEVLVKVERKLKLHVPAQLILMINGIKDAKTIRAGQTLKMIRGPFHAVVRKSQFVMDVFLEEPETHRLIFVRRFRVGLGKNGTTPSGTWRVAKGGKMTKADWTPPASMGSSKRKIRWYEKDYPLGKEGYWIALEGIGQTPYTKEDGYGIHGTNDPASIGKASSMGCIRLADDDIEMLFAMLYEYWSKVTILP